MSNNATDIYSTPLSGRYASEEMKYIFSSDKRYSTWRELWVSLAKAEKELGLNITNEQIEELKANTHNINYAEVSKREKEVKHDVMAHVFAYGLQCPKASGIIHLGATSCYVTDNADLINIKQALLVIKKRLVATISFLAEICNKYKSLPTLGFTHGQPASPVTVGKRASLWLQNFVENLDELNFVINNIKFLGCRGATGTQETFMKLFNGNQEKVKKLDELIAKDFGFEKIYNVSGQTYPRQFDIRVLNCMSAIASSAYKMAEDIRFLQHDKEIEEPFASNQIGSSAMAYKRNPMRCERICSLARFVQSQAFNALTTANVQWLERSLDDSANRRMSIPESFLATDAVLIICSNVTDGLVVNEKLIAKHLEQELPFMITEDILMKAVSNGGDRQVLHERIRVHSMESARRVKEQCLDNDLISRISNDPAFNISKQELEELLNPNNLVGRCKEQVEEYLQEVVNPILKENKELLKEINKELTV